MKQIAPPGPKDTHTGTFAGDLQMQEVQRKEMEHATVWHRKLGNKARSFQWKEKRDNESEVEQWADTQEQWGASG